ncbi:MAG: M56 family metallopeptidase [Clostridiales bacterium]|nr:M56 family metallopeptidase [Clostridiales bacterium]
MNTFFQSLLTASFHGSIVILVVMILRLLLKKTPRKFICYLWMLAGIRLLMPIPVTSRFSLQPAGFTIPVPINPSLELLLLWAAVAGVIGIISAVSYARLQRQVRDAVKVPGGWESDKIETAFVLGFVKPKIYIPTGMSGDTKKQILAHERTHLEKGDHWIKMIGFVALALHWFNPMVWAAYVLLCKDIEIACDQRVVQFMELEERKAYSSALLQCSTNRVHYAACPVAFGEVSVKYRIQSVLNYRKPGFWISMLGVAAVGFVTLCLITSPAEAAQVVIDTQSELRQMSHQDPADFSPEPMPEIGENPDWGVEVLMDVTSPTGGKLVYIIEDRFMTASESIEMTNGYLERWNDTAWEAVPSQSGKGTLFEHYGIGFATSRNEPALVWPEELDWNLSYGSLLSGDYRIVQTISSVSDTATFYTGFRIYREQLPSEEDAALERCNAALNAVVNKQSYNVLLSEESPAGNIQPVKRVVKNGTNYTVNHYLGEYCTSTVTGENAAFDCDKWQAPFLLDENRQFLFPEGKSTISQEEITFCSVWTDVNGSRCQGTDTYRFNGDGSLESVDRLAETLDKDGSVLSRVRSCMKAESFSSYSFSVTDNYTPEDSFTAQNNSPWGIFFRVDDDLLQPGGGEIWLATNAVGVSNYTTDCSYWLEKRTGEHWERLGGENQTASWGTDTIAIRSKTQVFNVDWSDVYGNLDAGVYRMGKYFYSGSQSIIQYAEFEIAPTGGVFGVGAEEALARVDSAIERTLNGNYRVEKIADPRNAYYDERYLDQVIWKYGDTEVHDVYKSNGLSHSYTQKPDNMFFGDWLKRSWYTDTYDCYYFPADYSVISDEEITFALSSSQINHFVTLYTYRFDEQGNLTEVIKRSSDSFWNGYTTHYVITQTPESEIQAWVEQVEAAKS